MKPDIQLNTVFTGTVTALAFGTVATLPLPWLSSIFPPIASQPHVAGAAAAGADGATMLLYVSPAVFAFLGFGFGFCMAKVFNLSRLRSEVQKTPPDTDETKARAAVLTDAA